MRLNNGFAGSHACNSLIELLKAVVMTAWSGIDRDFTPAEDPKCAIMGTGDEMDIDHLLVNICFSLTSRRVPSFLAIKMMEAFCIFSPIVSFLRSLRATLTPNDGIHWKTIRDCSVCVCGRKLVSLSSYSVKCVLKVQCVKLWLDIIFLAFISLKV